MMIMIIPFCLFSFFPLCITASVFSIIAPCMLKWYEFFLRSSEAHNYTDSKMLWNTYCALCIVHRSNFYKNLCYISLQEAGQGMNRQEVVRVMELYIDYLYVNTCTQQEPGINGPEQKFVLGRKKLHVSHFFFFFCFKLFWCNTFQLLMGVS